MQKKLIEKVIYLSEKIAENIENDKIIYVFGTGHSYMAGLEMFFRAGGLGNVCAMLDPDVLVTFGAEEVDRWKKLLVLQMLSMILTELKPEI